MTFDEIQAEIGALEALLCETAPNGKCQLQLNNGQSLIYMMSGYAIDRPRLFSGEGSEFCYGDNPREMLDAAWEILRALPDPEVAAKQNWQRKLADVIDEGHALNLPDDVLQPLRTGSQAMTENLLTHEAAQ